MAFQNQLIAIAVVVIFLFIIIFFTKRVVRRYTALRSIEPHRKKVILNIMYFLYYLISIIVVIGILGVELKQFMLFISSVLAVLGVGFFAQWSLLSNLTSSIILFFYHPVRIGDKIRILEKDYELTGKVKDIKAFYVLIKTEDQKLITIPTQLLLQKGIELIQEE